MTFVFDGTTEAFLDTLQKKADEHHKEILICQPTPHRLEIGFQRISHTGGRFFVADVTEQDGYTHISGTCQDVTGDSERSPFRKFLSAATDELLIYGLCAVVPVLLWLFLFPSEYLWIPFLLPIPLLVFLRLNAKRLDRKTDTDFIAFLSLFTTQNIPSVPLWDSAYRKLDLAGGTLQAFGDDDETMLQITYEDGMQIEVGYRSSEEFYGITVTTQKELDFGEHPIGTSFVKDKAKLAQELQKTIHAYRKHI